MKEIILHGCRINMDDDANDLRLYLEDHLETDEFQTIFGYAKHKGTAYFQDDERHHFFIEFDDDVYTVNER